jgi:hypothetical protein
VHEPVINYENKIIEFLKTGEYTAKDILQKLQMDWKEKQLRDFLKSHKDVKAINQKPIRFTLKNPVIKQTSLFD